MPKWPFACILLLYYGIIILAFNHGFTATNWQILCMGIIPYIIVSVTWTLGNISSHTDFKGRRNKG